MNAPSRRDGDGHKDPATLEYEADEARAHLEATVEELGQRLSPGELLDRALSFAREHGGELAGGFGRGFGRQVKANPMPAVLTGIGLVWMMSASNGARPADHYRSRHAADPFDETWDADDLEGFGSLKERLAETGESAVEWVQSKRQEAGQQASRMRYAVRQGAQDARRGIEDMLHENPLVVGAMGVALGAALGALLPETELEDEWLGETSEKVREKGKAAAKRELDEQREQFQAAAE